MNAHISTSHGFRCTRSRCQISVLALLVAGLCWSGLPAHAANTRVWKDPVNGGWGDNTKWIGDVSPQAGDVIYITNSGTFTVTIAGDVPPGLLFLGGIHEGAKTLDWTSGSLSLTVVIETNGVINMPSMGSKSLSGTLTNYGTIVWPAGSYASWSFVGGALENQPGALLDMQVDGQFLQSGGGVIHNAGTLRKSAGSATATFNSGFGFENTGLVDVQSGTLDFPYGFTSSSVMNVAGGAAITLTGGTFNFNPGHTFTGEGFYGVPRGAPYVNGPLINTNFQLTGGSLTISNQITGALLWGGYATLAGEPTIASNGVVKVINTGGCCSFPITLSGVLTNYGLFLWPSNMYSAIVFDNARMENMPGALVDMQLDGSWHSGPGGPGVLNNWGTFRKSGSGSGDGWGQFRTGFVFDNNGLVDLESGTIYFTDGFTSSGQFYVATNTAAELTGGTFHFLPGHLFNGPGTYGVFYGGVVIDGPITEPNFLLSSGTLTISNQITGTLLWGGHATLAGEPTIASNGVLKVINPPGGFPVTLSGVLTNYGLFLWPSNMYSAIVFDNARIENMPGALVDMQLDGSWHRGPGGSGVLNNWGTFRKSGSGGGEGWGQFRTGFVFDNNGLVDLESGTIYFTDGFTSSGQFYVATNTAAELTGGTFHFLPGHLFNGTGNYGVFGDVVLDAPITEPNFLLASGSLTMTNQITGTVVWQSGRLNGAPTIASNGVVRYVAGSAQPISGVLTNHGLFLWPTGTYTAIYFSNGRLENMADGLVELQVDAGFYSDGGGAQVNNAGAIRKTVGIGTSSFNPGVGLQNTGLLDIQSGTLQLLGTSLLAGGRINLGLSSASDFGRATFPGAASLAGTLSANLIGGYTPTPGTQFQVITSSGLSGGFTSFALPTHFFVTDNAQSVFLTVGNDGPATLLRPALAGTNFTFAFQSEAGLSYTVQSNDDLSTTNWTPVSTISGDGTLKTVLAPHVGVPQRFFRVAQP